jgi:hypothetical protein
MNDTEIIRSVRSCFGKRRYATEEMAKKYAKKSMKLRPVNLRNYHCKTCLGFHLTSQRKEKAEYDQPEEAAQS